MKEPWANKWIGRLRLVLLLGVLLLGWLVLPGAANADRPTVGQIREAIREKGLSWTAREYDRTFAMGLLPFEEHSEPFAEAPASSRPLLYPSSLDWRNHGGNFVSPVKDQYNCGSCWAFAAVGALESTDAIAKGSPGSLLDLSEQILVSCCTGNYGCDGGYMGITANFLKNQGTSNESCYPYKATNGSCSSACSSWPGSALRINRYQSVSRSVDALKGALQSGPLAVGFDVYYDFPSYSGGVYECSSFSSRAGGHAVLLVGYEDTPGQYGGGYFIVKNSWGTYWGESGYFRIGYSQVTNAVMFGRVAYRYIVDSSPEPTPSQSPTPTPTPTPDPAKLHLIDIPRIAAPGVNVPIAWEVTGLASVTETGIKWDTITHSSDDAYRYTAPSVYAKVGNNYTDIIVPSGATGIYFKAYAVSGGMTYWSPSEYNIKCERHVNVGRLETWHGGWEPDRDWETGGFGYGHVAGDVYVDYSEDIQGTEDDWLYYRQRIGLCSYHFYIGRGTYEAEYEVELHFAELQNTAAGQRVFNVFIEGEEMLHDFDIYQEAGYKTACIRTFRTTVEGHSLDIELTGDDPLLCAVRVRGIEGVPLFHSLRRVEFDLDDTYVSDDSTSHHFEDYVRLGEGRYDGGLRFQFLRPEHGSMVTEARLHLCAYADNSANLNLTIYGEDTDHAQNFDWGNPLVPNRPRTNASVDWAVHQDSRADQWHWSPDIGPVIQEILDRPGWSSDGSLVLLLIAKSGDTRYRDMYARDAGTDTASLLHIYYVPAGYVPEVTPTVTLSPSVTPTPTETPEQLMAVCLPLIIKS